MECPQGYIFKEQINDVVQLVENAQGETFIAKAVSDHELKICCLMADNHIAPRVHKICDRNIIIMQNYDGNLLKLWPFITETTQKQIETAVDKLIGKMHDFDIAHGDLHSRNIVYREENNEIVLRIIDYEKAFKISTGEDDQTVVKWMDKGFNWRGDYPSFVEFDFNNWKTTMNHIHLVKEYLFDTFDQKIIKKYSDGDCGVLAVSLSKKLQWYIYGIFLGEKNSVPAHYVLRAPGGEFFLDITGLRSKEYFERYWYNYFVNEDYQNVKVVFNKVDDELSNPDYYRDAFDGVDKEHVEAVAATIYQLINAKYNYDD